ncbi:inositol-trisphosphate 3-kinase A-like protein [Dinothrombium tinctorium]|uniref:Kinase n=1 Tax=Dinothrombium tinctorium TaxID=1965070 RepID=A0A3S3NWR4_9ACAR|nr:inositol-trisphosphate 3-kinase A-like protein [Dinothrombium tinctorium]RWS10888.1 inositol-trisphosphate 3-kinase A-like protein [Dinothrombium tinctorium]
MNNSIGLKLVTRDSKFIFEDKNTILKQLVPEEEYCFEQFKGDSLKSFVPPNIMDIKMGIRTVLEDVFSKESEKVKLRPDMFETMFRINPETLIEEEKILKAVTKVRYLQWLDENIWLIDFEKTHKIPEDVKITHESKWKSGNHEDGYLIGLNNLICIFKQV